MSKRTNLISYRLRDRIRLIEKLAPLGRRVQFSRSAGSSYCVGWDHRYTKPVKSSSVILYDASSNNFSLSFGISFNFYKEYSTEILPLEEQVVQFSLCFNPKAKLKGKDKLIQYSKPFDLVEAKILMRKVTDRLNEIIYKHGTVSAKNFSRIMNEVVFDFTEDNESGYVQKLVDKFSDEIQFVQQKTDDVEQASVKLKQARSDYKEELESDEDYVLLEKLRQQMEEVSKRVSGKRKSLSDKHEVKKLEKDLEDKKATLEAEANTFMKALNKYAIKEHIPLASLALVKEEINNPNQ